ncbi:unnamed protein product [Moneuplotes crassus]|uniref:NAD-dependent epimerase/dehydratase domain-containing protein n=1 Tax=Euplotes crassus TaxID=5936 RepID=A0AAD1UQL6_EUPCR|nr:unnamed protein product [Moneuplotes crassus]
MDQGKKIVLVTGATGYIGNWVIVKLLKKAIYEVRAFVREKEDDQTLDAFMEALDQKCPGYTDFSIVKGDILDYESVKKAVEDVTYVIHLACPSSLSKQDGMEEYINECVVDGNLNILQACAESYVKRVVITSSSDTMIDFNKGEGKFYHDTLAQDHPLLTPIGRSKIKGEKAAIYFTKTLEDEQIRPFELIILNPSLVIGAPLLPEIKGLGVFILKNVMEPGVPRMHGQILNLVHVKDVAQAHLNALERGDNFERYPLCAGSIKMKKVIALIKKEFESSKLGIPTRGYSKWRLWFLSIFDKNYERLYERWNITSELDGEEAKKTLHIKKYKNIQDSIIETCQFLIKNNLVKRPFVLPLLKQNQ